LGDRALPSAESDRRFPLPSFTRQNLAKLPQHRTEPSIQYETTSHVVKIVAARLPVADYHAAGARPNRKARPSAVAFGTRRRVRSDRRQRHSSVLERDAHDLRMPPYLCTGSELHEIAAAASDRFPTRGIDTVSRRLDKSEPSSPRRMVRKV